eukprot:gene32128-41657_t
MKGFQNCISEIITLMFGGYQNSAQECGGRFFLQPTVTRTVVEEGEQRGAK